jgi:hypothetical protein
MASLITVNDLIERLQNDFVSDEVVAYTTYSKGDVENVLESTYDRSDINADEVWNEVARNIVGAIDSAQADLNEYLEELVGTEVDEYEEPAN